METTKEVLLQYVQLDQIELSETNKMFRYPEDFTPAALQELADTISKAGGVLSSILLRPGKKKKYELVFGERRYRASSMLGLKTIPASIRNLTDEEALEAQVIENLQRENVNPMKEALAFEWMTTVKKMSTKQIADRIGKSLDYVQERIRLSTLTKEAQDLVRSGVLPLKAALKMARVPADMQKRAISDCITTVEGASGKTQSFKGLDSLQGWLRNNAFNDLAFADFDTQDPELVRAAGSCIACTQRTKNTGGLFDDISKTDSCLNGECFMRKQLAQYERVKSEVVQKFPGAEIVYRQRGYSYGGVDQAFKKLTPLISTGVGVEIKKEEMTERLELLDKGKSPEAKVVILFGIDRYTPADNKKKFVCISTKREASRAVPTTAKQKEEHQKQKEEQSKATHEKGLIEQLTSQHILKKSATIKSDLVRTFIEIELDDSNIQDDDLLVAFKSLGIDWTMEKRDGKKVTKISVKAKDADLTAIEDDHTLSLDSPEKIIAKLKPDQLNALFVWIQYCRTYGPTRNTILKALKIEEKDIKSTAKMMTAAWWKERSKKQVPPTKKTAKNKVKAKA